MKYFHLCFICAIFVGRVSATKYVNGYLAWQQNVICNCEITQKMTRPIIFLIILTLGFSCISNRQDSKAEFNNFGSDTLKIRSKKNIRFDFSAERINTFKETVEIKATLFNDNEDTVYFLSSSCDGEQYSLKYDTAKFVLTSFLNCNASFPILLKIAPKGQYEFQAHFRCRSNVTKIKLGFDFYSVDKSVDLNKISLADIHHRKETEQIIIWADEKTIK